MRRKVLGGALAVCAIGLLAAAMLPLRGQVSTTTTALVLVVPVVGGVAVGGFAAGVVGVVAGFVVYDFVFIPPYYTMSVGAAQNWVALGVYVVAMLVVARLVARLDVARSRAQGREDEARRLLGLSELLVADHSVRALLGRVADAAWRVLELDGVVVLLPSGGHLAVAAQAGRADAGALLHELDQPGRVPVALDGVTESGRGYRLLPLSAWDGPQGLLVLVGDGATRSDPTLLRAFANQLALAVERARLHDQAVRAELLEEADRLRRSLVSAVSHDLRTPLATIKVAASSLRDPAAALSPGDARELAELVDEQADRLDRLVANLLDMTRIQAGALVVRPDVRAVAVLVGDAAGALGPALRPHQVRSVGLDTLPLVEADPVLIGQVLANLLENAARHAPGDTPITVSGERDGDLVHVAVTDEGPGVAAGEQESIFAMFTRREAGGRAGLGLAIAKAFVEAHGQRIWYEDAPGGGARFVFSLPAVGAGRPALPAAVA